MKTNEQAFNDYNELLKPFDGTDIKYTSEDETEDGLVFIANVKNNDSKYDNLYNDMIKDCEKSDFDEYIKYTDYGYVALNNESDQITIEVFVEEDELDDIDELDETVTLKEGGIYPVMIEDAAKDALKKLIDSIIGGDNDIGELELIPALGYGGAGRYWYKTTITLSEETIIDYITEEDTPEAYRLMNNGDLVINSYSDIDITCSADSDNYHDGVTLDAMDYSNADMTKLIKESNFIGSIIIKQLFDKESEIVAKLQEYEIPEDDELDESKSLKKENFNSSKAQTMIDNIKNWTEYDVRIEVTYEDDDYATINVYMPETDEYVGEWEIDLSEAENQDYAGSIADEINAVDVEALDENLINIITNESYGSEKYLTHTWSDMVDALEADGYKLGSTFEDGDEPIDDEEIVLFKNNKTYVARINKYFNGDYEIVKYRIKEDDFEYENLIEFDEAVIPIKESDKDDAEYYQRNIYDVLDNITALADSYDNVDTDTDFEKLKLTISRIEDELNELNSFINSIK